MSRLTIQQFIAQMPHENHQVNDYLYEISALEGLEKLDELKHQFKSKDIDKVIMHAIYSAYRQDADMAMNYEQAYAWINGNLNFVWDTNEDGWKFLEEIIGPVFD